MKILLALLIFSIPYFGYANTKYDVSANTLNSITCPSGLNATDIFYSESAPLKVENRKDKVFFEFSVTKEEIVGAYEQTFTQYHYATELVTISLFCGDTEHILTLNPVKNKNGVNIVLEPSREAVFKDIFDGLKYEEQLSETIKMIFSDDPSLKNLKRFSSNSIGKINEVDVYLRNVYFTGKFTVKELYLYCADIASLDEESILSLDFIEYPLAVALLDKSFTGWSKAVVIEAMK